MRFASAVLYQWANESGAQGVVGVGVGGVKIPKGSYDDPVAPAWLPTQDKDGAPGKPIIRCACGRLAGIGAHHVHADGRVTASFFHPTSGWGSEGTGCGFHEFLELDGYDGPEWVPGT
jgi:hypothetical protein